MIYITVNKEFLAIVDIPESQPGDTVTYKIYKASDGSIFAQGNMTYVAGIEWKVKFTPTTLHETYILEVNDETLDIVHSRQYKALGQVWDASEGPGGILEVGVNTWTTGQEAEDYFGERLGSDAWNGVSDTDKIKALIMAYRQLTLCNEYSFPTDISLFSSAMKKGQCEQALFLLIHIEDIDKRKGLQAQGVKSANIVGETYKENMLEKMPIASITKAFLAEYSTEGDHAYAIDLERNEEEDVI